MFDEDFITTVAQGDRSIADALRKLTGIAAGFAESFGEMAAEVPACSIASEGDSNTNDHVATHIGVTQWLLGTRMRDQLADFVGALRTNRVFAAALLGRAIIETAAACVYWEERLGRSAEQDVKELVDDLHLMVAGGRFDWLGMRDATAAEAGLRLYGKGKEPEMPLERRAPNVMTMLEKLDRRIAEKGDPGVVRATYAMFSDFCHPAVGTALVLTEPGVAPGLVRIKGAAGVRETRWFFWNLGLIVAPAAYAAMSSLRALGLDSFPARS